MKKAHWQPDAEKESEVVRRIADRAKPLAIIVFGSGASGTSGENSDLDLLVVVPDTVVSCRGLAAKLRSLVADIVMPLDILVVTGRELARVRDLPGSVYGTALSEGRIVYGSV